MQYLGGKARLAKKFLPIVLANRKPGQFYVEPFLGGCNVLPHVDGPRIASDVNHDLVVLYRAIAGGWSPPSVVSESDYHGVRKSPLNHHPAMVAFVGYGCSFAGKLWGGYARNAVGHNYANGTRNSLLRIANRLQGVVWQSGSYDALEAPAQSILYCDPPYAGTTGYGSKFDHAKFWAWAERMAGDGHSVFVSEYAAPTHWRCVWEHEHFNSVCKKDGSPRPIERLFTL